MTKKLYPNIATKRFQELVKALEALESIDYSRMSDEGKLQLDTIWKLLGMPTNAELKEKLKQKEEIDK